MTLVVQIAGSQFELIKLQDLDIEGEWIYAIFKYGFILSPDGWASCGKICTVSIICAKWVKVGTQVW